MLAPTAREAVLLRYQQELSLQHRVGGPDRGQHARLPAHRRLVLGAEPRQRRLDPLGRTLIRTLGSNRL